MEFFKKLSIVSLLLLSAISVSAQKDLRIIATGELLVDWNWTAYDSCNKRIQSIVDCLDVAYPNYGKADLIGGNFEGFVDDGQMVTSWTPYSDDRTFHCAASDVIDSLMSVLGVNFICPVNNHAFDGEDIDDDPDNGRQGILQTKACLDARDILYAGIGNNMAEVKTPGVMTLDDGTTIGILCAGTNSNSDPPHATDSRAGMWHSLEGENGTASDYGFDRLVEAVKTHSPNYDYFIVYTHQHWDKDGDGEGYIDDSEDEEFLKYFQAYIDAGANICINDGPHQPCGWDVYNGGLLLFSNGNFFYNTRKGVGKYPWKSWASYVTDILFVDDGNGNKEVGAIKFIPCYGNDIGTEGNPDGNDEQERLHFKSRGVPELTKGSNALDIFERVNDITDNDRSLMQSSDDGIEVVSDGDVHIGYWPSKQVFDSISGGVAPDTVKPTVTADFTQECGIEAGTLVIKGGGPRNSAIVQAIKDNMGGESGPLVLIPTAKESEPDVDERIQKWIDLGFTDVSVLHTRDPAEANTEEFIQPLLKAKAVFMGGGRQWRLADSYNGTRTLVELKNLLLRGGVIAGSSAGATIQGSFLPRGDEDGSKIMISNEPEHLIGFGFIPNVAFDVHVDERDRWTDLYEVLEYDNTLLGIGISKSTAIVVKGKTFSIVGAGKVAVYTWDEVKDCAPDGECYLLLEEGDWYDLCKREQTEEPVGVPVHPATGSSAADADR